METITFGELIEGTGGIWQGEENRKEGKVQGISIDTRTIRRGDVFFALKGPRFDGHQFVSEALKKGAQGVVLQRGSSPEVPLEKLIFVENSLKAFGDFAIYYRRRFSLPIIAISGSNGKTTTKEMTAAVLSKQFELLKSEKSYNNLIGIPLTLFGLLKTHEAMVMEFGINQPGEMERLCQIAPPSVGVITQISETHLEFLNSLEGVLEQKSKLISNLDPDDHAVLNNDDPSSKELRKKTRANVITFSINGDGDLKAGGIRSEGGVTRFQVNGEYPFQISLLGEFNVKNALAALAVGRIFQIQFDQASDALRSFSTPPMRMEVLSMGGITLIDDSYNANPASMREAFKVLSEIKGRRKIAIIGDMLELGERGPECHLKVGEAAANLGINLLITSGPLSRKTVDGARSSGLKEAYFFEEMDKFLDFLNTTISEFREGDVILVKGSRGMKMENAVDKIKSQFKT
jgi:UDP-N-acetylmuramoyl-tripeptide--D-alanyl-D-alanine ligase